MHPLSVGELRNTELKEREIQQPFPVQPDVIGSLSITSTLAANTNISVDTARRWVQVLENIYYCFSVRPWFRNVPKTLRKQPKLYLWDWSMPGDKGARYENCIASHLLKAVHCWTDIGLGAYGLYYLRDKEKREADYIERDCFEITTPVQVPAPVFVLQ